MTDAPTLRRCADQARLKWLAEPGTAWVSRMGVVAPDAAMPAWDTSIMLRGSVTAATRAREQGQGVLTAAMREMRRATTCASWP
jgi:hypothetical protein